MNENYRTDRSVFISTRHKLEAVPETEEYKDSNISMNKNKQAIQKHWKDRLEHCEDISAEHMRDIREELPRDVKDLYGWT